jgi:CRISPR-associated endonuclease/helicase Cas3
MQFYAHSKENAELKDWQTLKDHLKETAEISSNFAAKFGCEKIGYLLGMLHDIGKYSINFQKYLMGQKSKGPDHSTAGAKEISKLTNPVGNLFAYTIAGHHAGLPNGKDNTQSDLTTRLGKELDNYGDWKQDIGELPEIPKEELINFCKNLKRDDDIKTAFAFSFFVRMLFSCLIDADRLNSEEFGDKSKSEKRKKYPSLEELKKNFDDYLKKFGKDSKINEIRAEILSKSIKAAENKSGFFQLTVPTGGGKTLSSMAFALNHAIKNNLDRIIYVIPYTSIIEQNAKVFRTAFGNLSDAVIEHHSNFDEVKISMNEDEEEIQAWELSTENWDAPVIITTTVQFFESLFSHRPSKCRKLHNIAKSVVILDEAQMLPISMLYPSLRALEELTLCYKTTVLLCTATQPAFEKRENFKGITLKSNSEIIGEPKDVEKLYNDLKRVEVTKLNEKVSDESIKEKIEKENQILCVVNTRGRARHIFELLKQDEVKNIFHLSANMCPEHRSQKINEIEKHLKQKNLCRVVSTQVIEAGVDIDFPVVYREIAGVDSIAQAAGRCNREGKLQKGKVFIFEAEDGTPKLFSQQADSAKEVFRNYEDALSLEAIKAYFELHFWKKGDSLDSKKILEKISEEARMLNFPFREISSEFKVIDDYSIPVLIPWGEGESLINELKAKIDNHREIDKKILRKLQRFTVNLYPKYFYEHLGKSINYLMPQQERFAVLQNLSIYSDDLGIILEDPYFIELNKCVV